MGLRGGFAAILGGACWLGLVMVRLRSVEETLWIARDDAVITLSHARNAAQFGSIGVSPGGDRVEGFSSPLHFVVSYLIHLVADPGYRSVSMIILVAMSAATGAAVVSMLRLLAHQLGANTMWTDFTSVLLTLGAAAWVVSSWTSVGWIGSGMENPVVICAGVVVVAMTMSVPRRLTQALLALSLCLFMVSRVEFAAFAVPFACAAAWAHSLNGPTSRRIRTAGQTVTATILLVTLVHVARRLYFGDWLPNTAVVQGRASGSNQLVVAALISAIVLVTVVLGAVRSGTLSLPRSNLSRELAVVVAALLAGLLVLAVSGQTSGLITDVLRLQPILPLLGLIAFLFVIERACTQQRSFLDTVFIALAVIPLSQYVALGPARLEDYRVAAIAVPFLSFWAASLGLRIVVTVRSSDSLPQFLQGSRRVGMACLLIGATIAGLALTFSKDQPRRLNWEITSASSIIDVVHEVRDRHLGDGLVILANPDLGKVSYDKSAIMVDLGMLGDPLLTRIAESRADLVIPYLHFIARPDVLESHGVWSCTYSAWLDSAEFAAAYVPHDEAFLEGAPPFEDCAYGGRWVIWLRTDAEAEYALTRELLTAPDPAAIIQDALAACGSAQGDLFRCQGVRRSLQRAAGELRATGMYDPAVKEMRASPSASLDVPLLQRGPGWAGDAFDGLIALVGG